MSVISKVLENITEQGRRLVKLLKYGNKDSVNAYVLAPFGDDFNIPKDYKAIYIETSNSSEPVCIGFVNKVILNDLNNGEKQVFSTNENGDQIAAFIKLLNTGIIHFNGDSDFIVGFNDLKSGFDKLVDDFNSFVDGFNQHTHLSSTPGTPTGIASASIPPVIVDPSTASIDSSKKENLKTE